MNFWLLLFLINIIFFLIPYLLNIKEQVNPFLSLNRLLRRKSSIKKYLALVYLRRSSDPFRIHYDFTIYILACHLFGLDNTLIYILGGLIGGFGWLIFIYSYTMCFVFRRVPSLNSNLKFAKTGLLIIHNKRFLIYALIVAVLLLLFYSCYSFTKVLLSYEEVGKTALGIAIILISLLTFYKLKDSHYIVFHYRVSISAISYLFKNITYNNRYNFFLKKEKQYFESFNLYNDIILTQKPNIRLFSVESYGSVAWRDPDIKKVIEDIYPIFETALRQKGYKVVTGLSTSPVHTGGSWLSYSTLLYGTRIDNNELHNLFFKQLEAFRGYQSLLHFLKKEGYSNYTISPLEYTEKDPLDWELVKNNLQYDSCIDCHQLKYEGTRLKWMNVRAVAPDQYTINKAHEIIEQKNKSPYSTFFGTVNSHHPYDSLDRTTDDWKDLNEVTTGDVAPRLKKNIADRYKIAIKYQLEFLADFITKQVHDDSVIVLYGDHQPPVITKEAMGFETPIHIISKNEKVLAPFIEQGFVEGFLPKSIEGTNMKHEGFYSLFMKGLNAAFGADPHKELPYFPDGIELLKT